jgi:hypothetical protein
MDSDCLFGIPKLLLDSSENYGNKIPMKRRYNSKDDMAFIQFFTSVSGEFIMMNRWESGRGR